MSFFKRAATHYGKTPEPESLARNSLVHVAELPCGAA